MAAFSKVQRPGLWLTAIALVAGGLAVWLFPRAMPTLALRQRLTRQAALQHADSFFQAHELAPAGARTAVRFESNDSLQTYVDLAGGGRDTLNAIQDSHDVALFTWSVRAFVPHDPHEARVDFAPDGRVLGFRRVFAESDARPELSADSARSLAGHVLADWMGRDTTRWRLASASYETRKTSGRVDRTYTFQRRSRRIADAPIRIDVVIAGDTPSEAHPYVVIPQSFHRRYGEMRSFNDLLAVIAQLGMLALLIVGAFVLRRYAAARSVRWRPAMLVGGVVGVLIFGAALNELPGSWFGYDTAASPTTFTATLVLGAVMAGVVYALVVGLTLAAAEALARRAFPDHLDWWKLWRYRGTRAVAGRVAGGYVAAAIGFAYVALFYLATRKLLGWWVPTQLVDDPNLIATPLPWLSGVAVSLQAGVWEESLFRALPLSLLALWVGNRPHRMRWLALGVVGTALVFGFAHSNYASWPPYSRGAEIFLEACFWGVLFLVFGLLVTVVAHFTYDLVLFGSFAASGSASAYYLTAAVIVLVLLAPALSVAWRWLRQRGLEDLPETARFSAWRPPPPESATDEAPAPPAAHGLSRRARGLALVLGGVAALLAVFLPARSTLGPPFTIRRAQAITLADSIVAARGVVPSAWTALARPVTNADTDLRHFLVDEHARALAPRLAARYAPPAWWWVRYVHTTGTPADRAEEWRVRLRPDGTPLDVHHVLPDSATRSTLDDAEARLMARTLLVRTGFDTASLEETDLEQTARPARRDVTLTYADTLLRLPAGAQARAAVTVTGGEVLGVHGTVDLPEEFERAQRERGSTRLVLEEICGVLFLAVVLVAGVFLVRRHVPVLRDGRLGRRAALVAVGTLSVVGIAGGLNSLPGALAGYDTAVPWGNFLGMSLVGVLTAVVEGLLAYGLWLALDALRRRVGVPLLPKTARARADLLVSGLGIGSVAALMQLARHLDHTGLPPAPTTQLGSVFPALGPALSIPLDAVMAVTGVAIPLLVIAGVSRRRQVRSLVAVLFLLPLLGVFLAATPEGASLWIRGAAFTALVLLTVGLWVRYWASLSALSWIVGILVARGLQALRGTVHAATPVEHWAGLLALVVSIGLIALAVRATGPVDAVRGGARPTVLPPAST